MRMSRDPEATDATLALADEAFEQRDPQRARELMARLSEIDEAWIPLHEVLHGLANGRTVHVIVEGESYSPNQAAEVLGVSRTVIRKLMDIGELPFRTKPGSDHRLIAAADLEAARRQADAMDTLASVAVRATTAARERGVDTDTLSRSITSQRPTAEHLDAVDALLDQHAAEHGPTAAFLRETEHVVSR